MRGEVANGWSRPALEVVGDDGRRQVEVVAEHDHETLVEVELSEPAFDAVTLDDERRLVGRGRLRAGLRAEAGIQRRALRFSA